MDTDKLYTVYTVKVEWVCEQHEDSDGNCIYDYCDEYTLTDFEILAYNEETMEATVFVTEPGIYSLIFADYEDTRLANVDIVEYDFKEGINIVPQEITNFTLTNGDKVLLWYDLIDLVPVFENCTFENMTVTARMHNEQNEDIYCEAIELSGFDVPGHFIKNIKFKNIRIDNGSDSRRQTIYLQCCEGISFENIYCR